MRRGVALIGLFALVGMVVTGCGEAQNLHREDENQNTESIVMGSEMEVDNQKFRETQMRLSDGRTVTCVSVSMSGGRSGGLSCDWESAG